MSLGRALVSEATAVAMFAIRASILNLALRNASLKCTRPQVSLGRLPRRRNVEVKDVHWQPEGCARIRDVDNTRDMALNWGTREEQVDLVITVSEATQILDTSLSHVSQSRALLRGRRTKNGLTIRRRHVHVMLLPMRVDTESLEVYVSTGPKLGLYGAGDVDWRLETKICHPVLEHLDASQYRLFPEG